VPQSSLSFFRPFIHLFTYVCNLSNTVLTRSEVKDTHQIKTTDRSFFSTAPLAFSSPTSGRRDMSPSRQKLFMDTLVREEKRYFGPEYGPKRLILESLSVVPEYHRRGVGKALMEPGLQMAQEQNAPITITSSVLGKYLYDGLGFKTLGYIECEIEGKGKTGVTAMVWAPEGWKPEELMK
jgi:GNAT superfamily N-acetyltransferase